MKFTLEIEINQPIKTVVELFDNPDNMLKWMEGLQSFEHISGIPGQPGSKSKLKFKIGNRIMEMTETIITRNLPEEFTGTYESNGGINTVKNKFIEITSTKTKYISIQEFQFKGLMKIMAFLMSDSIKKQSIKFLDDFKKFAEKS